METLTTNNTIASRVLKTEAINWRELKFVQTDNFKELQPEDRHKLKASIVSNNFTQPFYVWQDNTSVLWCLDGKHRTLLLEELIAEGVNVPYQLPATFIECENKKEAARLVLLFSSQYARVTQEGFHEFITLNDLNYEDLKEQIDLPDFNELRYEQKFDIAGINIPSPEDDVIEEVPIDVIVKLGDLFQLGRHRLICGSFEDKKAVKKLLNGEKARIIFTDPPYNLAANDFSNKGKTKHKDFAMAGGEMSDIQFMEFIRTIMKISCEHSINGSIHYICMDWRHLWHMTEPAQEVYGSVIPKQLVVWNKSNMANGSFYRAKHELVFIFKNGEDKHLSHIDLMDRIRTNVWDYPTASSFSNPDRKELENHPTPKPVQMVADAMLDTTNESDIVIDWFMGSGTSIIAAEKTKRICYGTEIEPGYVQSIIKRYIKFCEKNGIECEFKHLNGQLAISDFN